MASNAPVAYKLEEDPSLAKLGRKVVVSAAVEDEVTRKKREGTPVTLETFMAWRQRFEREMAAEAKRRAEEDLKTSGAAMVAGTGFVVLDPLTGRPKLTGKQLFESDSSLVMSDTLALETDAVVEEPSATSPVVEAVEYTVDASLFLADDIEGVDLDDDEEEWVPEDDDDDDDEEEDGDGGLFDESGSSDGETTPAGAGKGGAPQRKR